MVNSRVNESKTIVFIYNFFVIGIRANHFIITFVVQVETKFILTKQYMCTVTLSCNNIPTMEYTNGNRVFIEDGEVKTETISDTMDLEEARQLLHEMVDLEYSLP